MPTSQRASGQISIVVPVHNRRHLFEPCLLALVAAAQHDGETQIVVVDHSSTDGAREFAEGVVGVKVIASVAGTVGALRNAGVRSAEGEWVCFVDSDVLVPFDYCALLRSALASSPGAIVGRAYTLPPRPHWIESTWYHLNVRSGDGIRSYLNAGNIALSRKLFDELNGFDEQLSSGEDTDLARRAATLGIVCIQYETLAAAHLGNPKSISEFIQKQVWHGEGDKLTELVPKASVSAFFMYLVAAAAIPLLSSLGVSTLIVFVASFGAANAVPLLGYLQRSVSRRHFANPLSSVFLLHLYFSARFFALLRTKRS